MIVFCFLFLDMFEKGVFKIVMVGLFIFFCYLIVIVYLFVFVKLVDFLDISGYFFVCFVVIMMIVCLFIGKLFDKVGLGIVIYLLILIFLVGFCMLFFIYSGFMFLFLGVVIGFGYGLIVFCM